MSKTKPSSKHAPSAPGTAPHQPARQARSRQTAERIVAAALELISTRSFAELSVAEIAVRAGVSVGGFYARFPGKQALLDYLQADVIEGLLERAREQFDPSVTAQLDARCIIKRYMQMATDGFRQHRVVLRQVSLRSRTSSEPGFQRKVQDTNIELHGLFRNSLYQHLDQVSHPDPKMAIDLALTGTSAVMREYLLFADKRPQFSPIEATRLVAELTDMFCSYLRIPS